MFLNILFLERKFYVSWVLSHFCAQLHTFALLGVPRKFTFSRKGLTGTESSKTSDLTVLRIYYSV